IYHDYRAVFTNSTAPREALARAAKESETQVVISSNSEGLEGGVLFLKPLYPGFEVYKRSSVLQPERWRKALKQKQFSVEIFGAGTDAQPELLSAFDKEAAHGEPVGIAQSDPPEANLFPLEASFRTTTTHILARGLTPFDVTESLKKGHT